MPFVKGQSGNPGGRPKEVADVRALARQSGKDAIATLKAIMDDVQAPPAARIAASVALLDRGYGRPEQRFEGALNVVYQISDRPLSPEEWVRQYASPSPESQH
jgi:hypothetical protein